MSTKEPGTLFIVAAPSGGGKTSLVRHLASTLNDIAVSVSHTTRLMRPGEQEGCDYFFLDDAAFMAMVNEGEFIEHACVFNHMYGTSKSQITARLQQGIDVLLDIDWQGAQQIRHLFPESVGIFVIPPSLEALKDRLMNRKQDDASVIEGRMKKAQDELSHFSEFDYLIVNDNFEHAAVELRAVVLAHRLCMKRQAKNQAKLLSFLLSSK